ncbi:hypothetical protein [Paraburkholderia pallida]|uniref:Uncharacterized protein n=1 Tax=Paraburkholderia pallida TaxID=2547399 RepID=A0A4P7CPV6_9BURK|nr:hypothetical protein [Paraburkholderia pallida]QBQ96967.1 hypothetical protein E1956_07110 [Paraburkholderia pallida]
MQPIANRRHPDAVPFFVSPPAWVLVHEPTPGESHVATESADEGRAILCFLSPLDALIEVARFAQLGQMYHVMPAAHLDGGLFRDADGRGLVACIHAGWPTYAGRILLRPGGALGRYDQMIHIWANDPPWFEVDPATLKMIDHLHEQAGLFAWRETHRAIHEWSGARMSKAVGQALRSAPALDCSTRSSGSGTLSLLRRIERRSYRCARGSFCGSKNKIPVNH